MVPLYPKLTSPVTTYTRTFEGFFFVFLQLKGFICYCIISATSFSFKFTFEDCCVILYYPIVSLAPQTVHNSQRQKWSLVECVIPVPPTKPLKSR